MITTQQVLDYVSPAGMRGTNDPAVAAHWQARGMRVYGVVVSRNTNTVEQTEYLVGVVAPNSITGQLFGRGGNDSEPIFWVASKMPSEWSSADYPPQCNTSKCVIHNEQNGIFVSDGETGQSWYCYGCEQVVIVPYDDVSMPPR